ncbi:MAG: MMPL family transporter, partial [Candidatus Tectomicrobia bacterium]|nr:MMPL family transporter [Candidatus Tectomicrobia bacterium]
VNHNQIESIAHLRTRTLKITPEGLIRSIPLLPTKIPQSPEVLARIREECFSNDTVYGRLVSYDGKGALVTAAFLEQRVDYGKLFDDLQRLERELEDENTEIYITGQPMLYGWIAHYYAQTLLIFAITLTILLSLLVVYFRRLVGVVVPLAGAVVSTIWGLGFTGMLGYNFDPLTLVIPLLITARCISHGVQLTERYLEEYEVRGNKEESVVAAMGELFLPGMIGIITDAGGIFVIAVAAIPIMRKLAFFCSFWAMSISFSVMLLGPILLSYLPAPRKRECYKIRLLQAYLGGMGRMSTGRLSRWAIMGGALILLAASLGLFPHLVIGDNSPGSPLLYRDHDYNVSAAEINRRFAGTNHFSIIFSGDRPQVIKEPRVLSRMEELQDHLLDDPKAGGARSLAILTRSLEMVWHYFDPKWEYIPETQKDAGNLLFIYEVAAPVPRILSSYMDYQARESIVTLYYKDTQSDTIQRVLQKTQEFIASHPIQGIQYKLAGGEIGVLAAINEMIKTANDRTLYLVLGMVFLCVFLSYYSLSITLLIMAPLLLATLICVAYMVLKGIGMNVNTLPVTGIGIGVGVDYAVYIVDRMRQEYHRGGGDIDGAIQRAIATTGMAVSFTAACLVGVIIFWYLLSDIRFQGEMAILLSLLMALNGLMAVTLVPAVFSLLRPKLMACLTFCAHPGIYDK